MPIYSSARGYCYSRVPDKVTVKTEQRERELFEANIGLLLQHEPVILSCADYFFCPLSMSYCAVGFPGASILEGAFRLGHLLIGWRDGGFTDRCPTCSGEVLITAFGGIRSYWWQALCLECNEWCRSVSSRDLFEQRKSFADSLVKSFPDRLEQWQEFDGFEFDWVDGLRPARKTRWTERMLYNPAQFEELINELRSGRLRQPDPPVEGLSQQEFKEKFSKRELGHFVSRDL